MPDWIFLNGTYLALNKLDFSKGAVWELVVLVEEYHGNTMALNTHAHVLRRAAFCRISSADVDGASTGDAVEYTTKGALDVRLLREN